MHEVRLVLSHYGYLALYAILLLDSLGVPLPTELSLLVAGYLVHLGDFRLWPAVGAAWAGSLTGSALAYAIGRWLGPAAQARLMRLFRLTPEHMGQANAWFNRHGPKAVFFARFIPVVRNYISYPAGIVRMRLWKYAVFTAAGYGAWEFISVYLSFRMGKGFKLLLARMDLAAWILAGLAVLAGVLAWAWHRYQKRGENKPAG